MGEKEDMYKLLVRKLEGRRPLGRLDIDRKSMLKWIMRK
jgi:hypothetical protein